MGERARADDIADDIASGLTASTTASGWAGTRRTATSSVTSALASLRPLWTAWTETAPAGATTNTVPGSSASEMATTDAFPVGLSAVEKACSETPCEVGRSPMTSTVPDQPPPTAQAVCGERRPG